MFVFLKQRPFYEYCNCNVPIALLMIITKLVEIAQIFNSAFSRIRPYHGYVEYFTLNSILFKGKWILRHWNSEYDRYLFHLIQGPPYLFATFLVLYDWKRWRKEMKDPLDIKWILQKLLGLFLIFILWKLNFCTFWNYSKITHFTVDNCFKMSFRLLLAFFGHKLVCNMKYELGERTLFHNLLPPFLYFHLI